MVFAIGKFKRASFIGPFISNYILCTPYLHHMFVCFCICFVCREYSGRVHLGWRKSPVQHAWSYENIQRTKQKKDRRLGGSKRWSQKKMKVKMERLRISKDHQLQCRNLDGFALPKISFASIREGRMRRRLSGERGRGVWIDRKTQRSPKRCWMTGIFALHKKWIKSNMASSSPSSRATAQQPQNSNHPSPT